MRRERTVLTTAARERSTPVLASEEVLPTIRRLRDRIEASAEEAEQGRTLPQQTVAALADAGLFSLMAPREVGGSALDPLVGLAAVEEMTSYDTSAGWAMAIGNGGSSITGARLSDTATAEVFEWPTPRVPLFAGSFAPTGRAVAADGGYFVTGRWSFASGIRHAEWVTGGCVVDGDDGQPEILTAVLPIAAVHVIDNWHVAGLQGTGSDDWEARDAFVPTAYTMRPSDPARRGGPTHALPLFAYLGFAHAGFALGCARRSLHDVTRAAGDKVRLLSSSSVAARSAFQRDLGRAEAALRAARLLVVDVIGGALDSVARGDTPAPTMDAEVRVAATHATEVAAHVCTMAFHYLGANAVYTSSPVQRYFRDIHVAAQHAFVSDTTFEDLARMRLGL
jgi:alkylation response protein AidB-like acyl-CoA dehydrogenase